MTNKRDTLVVTDEEIEVLRMLINTDGGPLALKMLFWDFFNNGMNINKAIDELIEKFFKDNPKRGEIFKKFIKQSKYIIK